MCYIGNASLTGAAGHDLLPGPGQPLIRNARGGALSLERRHPLGAQFEVIKGHRVAHTDNVGRWSASYATKGTRSSVATR